MDINFNDWEFHELSQELNHMTLHQMLDKHKQLDNEMADVAKAYVDVSQNGEAKSDNEKKFDTLHKQQVFVAVRIAKEMTGV